MAQTAAINQPFDIRRHLPDHFAKEQAHQSFFDRLNVSMSIVGDLTFRELLTTKPQILLQKIAARIQGQKAPAVQINNASALLQRVSELVALCGDRNGAIILCQRPEDDAKLADAIEAVRKEAMLLPALQKGMDTRRKYLRQVVMGRIVRILGHYTPRDMFEISRVDGSELELSVILEAKVAGFFAASFCGGNGDPPPITDCECIEIEGQDEGACQYEPGANCTTTTSGFCSLVSDGGPNGPDGPDEPDEPQGPTVP